MGDYEAFDLHKENETIYVPNGGINNKYDALDNPAFRPNGPYTITSGNLSNGVVHNDPRANHLIYDTTRRKPDLDSSDIFADLYSSTTRGDLYQNPYATTRRQPTTLGVSTKSSQYLYDWGMSQTLGRSVAPSSFFKFPDYGTVSGGAKSYLTTGARVHYGEGKESCISFFDIETDKVSSYQYRPGEEITGVIKLFIRKGLEFQFLELLVIGQGHVTVRRESDGVPQTRKETYLRKHKCVLGTEEGLSTVLVPGQYTSKFRVKLPGGMPSTLYHDDQRNGFSLDITYVLKARLCDDVGVPVSRYSSRHRHNKVRVFLEKVIPFNVQRGFDLSTIPDALSAVTHTEQIYLSCTHVDAAIVSMTMDRAVFMAGDDLKVRLETTLPAAQMVKEITCALLEYVTLDPKQNPMVFTVSKIARKDPQRISEPVPGEQGNGGVYEVTIPTMTNLLSPYSLGVSHIQVEYFLEVVLRFIPAGGKLSFKVPVGLGPCGEPIYAEKISSRRAVPLFNRPTRFPFFSTCNNSSSDATTRPSTPRSIASVNVTTKYSNNAFARCFLCCSGISDD